MKKRTNGLSSIPWIAGIILVAVAAAVLALLFMDPKGEKGSGLGKEFQYNLDSLRKTDPALILYGEEGPAIHTGLAKPSALAVGPDDVIYVAGDRAVFTFSPAGEKRPLEIGLEEEPRCVAVADDGTVYVGLKHHVARYNHEGRLEKRYESAGPDTLFTAIAVSPEGVFVADFGKKTVVRYDASGRRTESLGDFVIPSPFFDLALAPDGLLHVANTGEHRIEAYTLEGNLMAWWGAFSNIDIAGFSGCCNPVNFALLPEDGGFVTCEKGLTRVKVYDKEGVFKGVVAGPERFARHDSLCASPDYDLTRVGLDVAVDSKGRILVLDPATASVRIFKLGDQ